MSAISFVRKHQGRSVTFIGQITAEQARRTDTNLYTLRDSSMEVPSSPSARLQRPNGLISHPFSISATQPLKLPEIVFFTYGALQPAQLRSAESFYCLL